MKDNQSGNGSNRSRRHHHRRPPSKALREALAPIAPAAVTVDTIFAAIYQHVNPMQLAGVREHLELLFEQLRLHGQNSSVVLAQTNRPR